MEKPAASTELTSTETAQPVPTCLYPSKPCTNPRGIKRNGEWHNFCDYHRNKATLNQRRLQHKRKYQQDEAPKAAEWDSSPSAEYQQCESVDNPRYLDPPRVAQAWELSRQYQWGSLPVSNLQASWYVNG